MVGGGKVTRKEFHLNIWQQTGKAMVEDKDQSASENGWIGMVDTTRQGMTRVFRILDRWNEWKAS